MLRYDLPQQRAKSAAAMTHLKFLIAAGFGE
jgi:hypothetical protein